MRNPSRCFNSSPEIVCLAMMICVRYPLSLRQVEDLLAERGIDLCHETVRFWWNRFGPMLAAETRKWRIRSRPYSCVLALAPRRGVRSDQRRDALPLACRRSRGPSARCLRQEAPGSQGRARGIEARDEAARPAAGGHRLASLDIQPAFQIVLTVRSFICIWPEFSKAVMLIIASYRSRTAQTA